MMSAIVGLHLIWLLLKFIVCSGSQECVHVFAPPASMWALLIMISLTVTDVETLLLSFYVDDDYLW